MTSPARLDIFISADVETDGPVPGPFSMLSFGLVAVGRYDGAEFMRIEPGPTTTFYREIRPISDQFEPEALAVNGLDRDRLAADGEAPETAMTAAARWVSDISAGCRPVLVAYPVAFDWSFLYWYFQQFSAIESPFGHSSCFDIRTLYQAITGSVFDRSGKDSMPEGVKPEAPHTHNALDDAIEQGELFVNLFELARTRRGGSVVAERDLTPAWVRRQMVPAR